MYNRKVLLTIAFQVTVALSAILKPFFFFVLLLKEKKITFFGLQDFSCSTSSGHSEKYIACRVTASYNPCRHHRQLQTPPAGGSTANPVPRLYTLLALAQRCELSCCSRETSFDSLRRGVDVCVRGVGGVTLLKGRCLRVGEKNEGGVGCCAAVV